jgi:uncharacterized protein
VDAVVEVALAGAWMRESALHGEAHWRCVAASGLALAGRVPGSDPALVFLFGLLHDTRRENEAYDPGHGARAAVYARELAATGSLALRDERLELLCHALELHSDGQVSDDPTVGVCWDADRLHLPRVGIDPDPALFSTGLAAGPEPLDAAARLREQPPAWSLLSAIATRRSRHRAGLDARP